KMDFEIAQQRRKAVGIFEIGRLAIPQLRFEYVSCRRLGQQRRVEALRMQLLHEPPLAASAHPCVGCLWEKRSNLATAVFRTVRAQNKEWIGEAPLDHGFHLCLRHRAYYGKNGGLTIELAPSELKQSRVASAPGRLD